jgi:hypothetical protein
MLDLRKYTTNEFAELIKEDVDTIRSLMRNNDHLGYTDKPYYHTVMAVQNSTVKDSNKEIVAKFIYTNLFNRPEHRFYDTKGYSIALI